LSKPDSTGAKKERNKAIRWVVTIFLSTILITSIISLASEEIMSVSAMPVAFAILLVIIFVGILFDIIGVAVTSADEKPFHSMAARKVPGALESIRLLRNAEKVGSICNDVVGDICGVISGSASATIAAQVLQNFEFSWPRLASLIMSALVAGLTVGGKAVGKSIAINSCTKIVHFVGLSVHRLHKIGDIFKKRK
jgi:hypothetical protein